MILLFIWYKMPIKVQKSYTASTIDGKSIELKINFTSYRSLLIPDRIKGTLSVDGVNFIGYPSKRDNNLFEHVNEKLNGRKYYPIFYQEGITGIERVNNMIFSLGERNRFNEIYIVQADMNSSTGTVVYYAPANTSTEAKHLSQIFLNQ